MSHPLVVKKCTFITTDRDRDELVNLILNEDNTFGAMSSGGYAIKKENPRPGRTTVISFREQDCAPARSFVVFIKDGNIWCNRMASWLMKLLQENEVRFTCEQIEVPQFIIKNHLALMLERC